MDALLLHAKTKTKLINDGEKLINQLEPLIYLYVDGDNGRYEIISGRLYYRDNPTDNHYHTCSELITDLNIFNVVIMWGGNRRHSRAYSWDDYLIWLDLVKRVK